jgi:hypothetical protein
VAVKSIITEKYIVYLKNKFKRNRLQYLTYLKKFIK